MKSMYTAVVTATGGRNGKIVSDNGVLNLEIRTPKALGGANDDFTNPEQLFAGGYAACFDSALNLIIRQEKIKTGETSVKAQVDIGKLDKGGFGLAVKLWVNIPQVSPEQAQELVEKAHEVCPYSNATRGNIEVKISVSTENL